MKLNRHQKRMGKRLGFSDEEVLISLSQLNSNNPSTQRLHESKKRNHNINNSRKINK